MRFTRSTPSWRWSAVIAMAMTVGIVTGCQDMGSTAPEPPPSSDGILPATVAATVVHPGRSLAANCFQCHGTNGVAGELKIAGESSTEIISELNEMRAKSPGENIMNVHAAAYTTEEIARIADYFAHQGG